MTPIWRSEGGTPGSGQFPEPVSAYQSILWSFFLRRSFSPGSGRFALGRPPPSDEFQHETEGQPCRQKAHAFQSKTVELVKQLRDDIDVYMVPPFRLEAIGCSAYPKLARTGRGPREPPPTKTNRHITPADAHLKPHRLTHTGRGLEVGHPEVGLQLQGLLRTSRAYVSPLVGRATGFPGTPRAASELAAVPGGRRFGWITTFSSFEYETYQAMRDGARWMGLIYVLGSVALGYIGVWFRRGACLAALTTREEQQC